MMSRCALVVFLLVAGAAPSAWLAWTFRELPHFGWIHDDGIYVVTAKALAEGQGYRIASFPGAPYQTKYPPLYPAILALIWRWNPHFPENLSWFLLLSWMGFAVFLAVAYRVFRRFEFSETESAALTAAVGLTPPIAYYGTTLMPNLWFCAVLLAGLLWAERGRALVAGVACGVAFLTKTMALPAIGSVALLYLWRRRPKSAVAFLAGAVPFVGGWFFWVHSHAIATTDLTTLYYTDYLGYHLQTGAWRHEAIVLWKNLGVFFGEFGSLVIFNLSSTSLGVHLSRLLTAAAIAGVVRLAAKGAFLHYVAFSAAFLAQLLLWNFPPSERFLFVLYPLLLAGLYRELSRLVTLIARTFREATAASRVVAASFLAGLAAVGITLVFVNGRTLFRDFPATNRQSRDWRAACVLDFQWMVENLPSGARILADYDPVLYLYTGRQSSRLSVNPLWFYLDDPRWKHSSIQRAAELAHNHQMAYVYVTDADFAIDLPPPEQARALHYLHSESGFELLHRSRHGAVYRIP